MTQSKGHGHDHSGSFAGMHSHGGGPPHWHDEFGEHNAEDLVGLTADQIAAKKLDWQKHNVQIVTVGVDIGSSTSHLMFSKIFIQLVGDAPEVHSVVVGREILWKSPIILTPYLPGGAIDAEALRHFVISAYTKVGANASDVDSGVVILTGEALKRSNARNIAELFSMHTGKFVCATAGHHMEAVLAANGSGTVARSRRDGQTLLNVDIGGGTTKMALVRDGEIVATTAVSIGARQLVKDKAGKLTRVDEPVQQAARYLGIALAKGGTVSANDEAKIVQAWVDILAGLIARRVPEGLAAELMLMPPLPADPAPQAITFSGGVSEFIFFRETLDFGDLGKPLAKAIRTAMTNGSITLPAIVDPNLGIRATAIGASQFTVQVGINLHITDERMLPLRNVPVLVPKVALGAPFTPADVASAIREAMARATLDEGEQPVVLAFPKSEELDPSMVRSLAEGIRAGLPQTVERMVPFVLMVDQNVAKPLGTVLKQDLQVPGNFLAMGGVTVAEFDFVDIGYVEHPAEVVPVTIKSLLFAGGLDRRSIKQALLAATKRI